jgi:hypothetical protein
VCRGYGDIAALAGEALIETQRMMRRRKHGDDEVTVFAITAAMLDRELQERGVFSIGRADREAIIRIVSDAAALANGSLTTPLNVEMIEQEPGSR